MFKSKKAQVSLINAMLGLMLFIALIQLINPIKDTITDARDVSNLDCDNTSITTGNKGTCVVTDWTLFGFVGTGIFVAIGILGIKKLIT